MRVLPVRHLPDPVLKRPARPVGRMDAAVRKLVEELIATMRAHPRCVGLAAPQVGVGLRVAVMDARRNPKMPSARGLLILINPALELGPEQTVQREGCLSIPDFTANVARATRVQVTTWDAAGHRQVVPLEGFEAIVAQHEIDHLNGKLFLDRVTNATTDVFRRRSYG